MTDLTQRLPQDKTALIERIEAARAALDETISRLTDAQLVAPGPYEGWSVKDHLAHLAAWERGIAALLRRRPRYEAMGVDERTYLTAGTDGINAAVHEHGKDLSLADVLAEFRQTQQDLLAALTDADLFKTYSHYQPNEPGKDSGAPIVKWIAGNTYEHYAEHVAWLMEHAQLQS
ncbi:MAG: ClbS/DfsB family four-helix bundle protein [Dehalococcoidia bacterium]